MSDVSPVGEQARLRAVKATPEDDPALWKALQERGLMYYGDRPAGFIEGWRQALAVVRAQARERTPWTGRALFERFEHEAERGRGWPRLSKVGKHSWDALAERIEGEVLAGPRGQDEQQLADAMTLLDRWLHKMGAIERENTRTMTEDFLAAAAVSPVPGDAGDERQRVLRGALTGARAVLETALDAETVELREFSEALLSIRAALDVCDRESAGDERQPDAEALAKAYWEVEADEEERDGYEPIRWDDERHVTGERTLAIEKMQRALAAAVPSVAQAPTPEDEPRGDGVYENGRGARASGRSLQENPYRREADYARWAQGWLDEHHGKPRIVRTSTGTEDALRKALRPFEGCWSWGVDVQLADVGALENAARAVLAAARPVTVSLIAPPRFQ